MTQTAAVSGTSSHPLRILLTGAFGNIAIETLRELLRYQRYGFALYRASLMRRMQRLRRVVRPLRRPIRRFMLLHSPTMRRA